MEFQLTQQQESIDQNQITDSKQKPPQPTDDNHSESAASFKDPTADDEFEDAIDYSDANDQFFPKDDP